MNIKEYCFKIKEINLITKLGNELIKNCSFNQLKELDSMEKKFNCDTYDLIKRLLTAEEIINLSNRIS